MKWSESAYRLLSDLAGPKERELIGELAVEEGKITPSQLEECLRDQREAKGEDPPPLGELLVRKGHLTPGELAALLERQTDEAGLHNPAWRYEIREPIGRGATAVVYRAWDRELRRDVALKVLRQEHVQNPEIVKRMVHEARAEARLSHPNIVSVHDVVAREEMICVVMNFVEGQTLSERFGSLPQRSRIEMVAKIAEAVHHAHTQGVIHRDLKPRNILVDANDKPFVTDFGLARLAGSDSVQTRAGSVVGTPLYMAPEQVRGDLEAIDSRSDVYSLGAILYEMLTGAPPFVGETTPEIYHKALHVDPDPPAGAPRDLRIICLKALEKESRARYESAGAMAQDLRRYLDTRPILARPTSWAYRLSRMIRRHPVHFAVLGGATLINLLVAITPERVGTLSTDVSSRHDPILNVATIRSETVILLQDARAGRLDERELHGRIRRMLGELKGDDPPTRLARAELLLLSSKESEAEQELRSTLRREPDFGPAWLLLSHLLSERRKTRLLGEKTPEPSDELLRALSRGITAGFSRWGLRETPRDGVLRTVALARHARWLLENEKKATGMVKAARKRYRAEEYVVFLARVLLDRAETRADYDRAVEVAPNYAPVWANRGLFRRRSGDEAGAEEDMKKALELDPSLEERLPPK